MGENYVDSKEQTKTNICKKYGINLEKPTDKTEEVVQKKVVIYQGGKTRKTKLKKSDMK